MGAISARRGRFAIGPQDAILPHNPTHRLMEIFSPLQNRADAAAFGRARRHALENPHRLRRGGFRAIDVQLFPQLRQLHKALPVFLRQIRGIRIPARRQIEQAPRLPLVFERRVRRTGQVQRDTHGGFARSQILGCLEILRIGRRHFAIYSDSHLALSHRFLRSAAQRQRFT